MVLSKRPWCKGHTNFNQKTDVADFKKKRILIQRLHKHKLK